MPNFRTEVLLLVKAYIKGIEYYCPQQIEANPANDKLTEKIGILTRHIAKDNELASDLAYMAAEKLFKSKLCEKEEIDFLLYCTQSPDHFLPTTACLLQSRLNLPTTCGAFDYNLGCSGYVYGLSIAKGLIESGAAKNILLITSDTYSKYIHPLDRSVKVLFGDAATATLVSSTNSEDDLIGPFDFGTDGRGADNLIVPAGALKEPISSINLEETTDSFGNVRMRKNLYMNGPEVFNFTLKEVPRSIQNLLEKSNKTKDDYDLFIFHQANKYMLEHLRKKLHIDEHKFSICIENFGNTVSSTIPIALKNELIQGRINNSSLLMLVGFGVGYSWASCNVVWKSNT